jgi:hypothetical protein
MLFLAIVAVRKQFAQFIVNVEAFTTSKKGLELGAEESKRGR